jgi:MFS family permease
MLLLPLYLQVVRGESAMDTGLLLAPQGFGAMLSMPIAGRLTDKTGVGKIVPFGLILVALSFLALTQLEADTSYVWFGVVLWVMGLGMGATMMPTFSGAMQTLRQSDVARASTTLNIQQQVGASIGTALMSVLLTHEISQQFGGRASGGIGSAAANVPPAQRDTVMAKLADAFGHTYWYALALVIVAFVVATPLLPKHRPPAPVAEPGEEGEAEPTPVLMH